MKRTLALAEIPDAVDSYAVSIYTFHKFIYELLIGFGIAKDPGKPDEDVKRIPDFFAKYHDYVKELCSFIDQGVVETKDLQDMMANRHDIINWDYVLIDEAQDCTEQERDVLFKIFSKEKVIVADGIDQLIRSQKKCNWTKGSRPAIHGGEWIWEVSSV